MTDRSGGSSGGNGRVSAAGTAARGGGSARTPGEIRNVVLVGHSGAGKTTLVESLLVTTGVLGRAGRVEDGTTVSDHDEAEHRQGRSVGLSLVPVEHDGVKINLLDTPGYADFVGDLRAGLRAADAALFVVSAADGVDGATRVIWEECAAVGMPRAVVVTRLDSPRADFDETVAICQRVFGADDPDAVLPVYLPLHTDDGGVGGLIGLLTQRVCDYSSGSREVREPDAEHLPLIAEARGRLIEGIIAESEDETLMDRYLGGEEIEPSVLIKDLETAVVRGTFHPVLPCAALSPNGPGVGLHELLDLMVGGFPSPLERDIPPVTRPDGSPASPLVCDPTGPLAAEVVKTSSDPYLGRINLLRVFSGTLTTDAAVHVCGHGQAERGHPDHDEDERVSGLSSLSGRNLQPLSSCGAGDLCAVTKLSHAETGDTVSAKDNPLLMEPWVMPEPLLPVAIRAHAKADEDKLSQSLARLVAEDPTMRLEMNGETGQLVLWCMGEAHVDVLLDRLRSRYGVAVDTEPHRVTLRETFAGPAKGHGRHVKQSGGHGQYAICDIEIEPLPSGSGLEFVDRIVGGAIPRQFIPSVEKGIRAQMTGGLAGGRAVVDLRVILVDGKAHSVDSSDMAFQTAGSLALRDAAANSQILILEPVSEIAVDVADEYVGAVMSDLSSRRGRVTGTEGTDGARTRITAEVPETELTRYAVDLRSLSHGTGTFARHYLRHEPMPPQLATRIRAEENA